MSGLDPLIPGDCVNRSTPEQPAGSAGQRSPTAPQPAPCASLPPEQATPATTLAKPPDRPAHSVTGPQTSTSDGSTAISRLLAVSYPLPRPLAWSHGSANQVKEVFHAHTGR